MQKPHTIAFDGKRAVLNFTGIGNYSRLALESALPLLPDGSQLILYTPRVRPNSRLEKLAASPRVSISTPRTLLERLTPHIWRSKGIVKQMKRDKVDLYHGLSNELPLGIEHSGIPSVVTIHDLIFMRHPEFYHRADVEICRRKFEHAARVADRVIAISARTADDLRELFGIPQEKIRIVYQGCAPLFHRPVGTATMEHIRSRYGTYIVGVGTIESRKNQLLAVRALPMLPPEVNLVLVGRRTAYARDIDREAARLGVSSRIFYPENVTVEDVHALFQGAGAASYPSFYEGFGIPVIEALASGTPVVAATGSCLEEAGGPGAIYVSPTDPEEFAHAVRRIISSPSLRADMVARGQEYIKRFAPENFGRGLVDVYDELL